MLGRKWFDCSARVLEKLVIGCASVREIVEPGPGLLWRRYHECRGLANIYLGSRVPGADVVGLFRHLLLPERRSLEPVAGIWGTWRGVLNWLQDDGARRCRRISRFCIQKSTIRAGYKEGDSLEARRDHSSEPGSDLRSASAEERRRLAYAWAVRKSVSCAVCPRTGFHEARHIQGGTRMAADSNAGGVIGSRSRPKQSAGEIPSRRRESGTVRCPALDSRFWSISRFHSRGAIWTRV